MTSEKLDELMELVIKPCPKCSSENINVVGLAWVQILCLSCEYEGHAFSMGSRADRYTAAINDWNEQRNEE